MGTPVTNFGKVTVSLGYSAAATSIVLTTGHGSRLPSTFPYPLTWWNATDFSDAADDPNREIVNVTNRVGDTLTVTRGHESTTASTKNTASKTYKMLLGVTKAMWDSIFNLSLSQDFRGLSLQTHPDSDKALAQVRLIHADAIVMDDGEEISDWNDLDANIAVSGIGGLDSGTEQASTWYQVIAGYNGTTKRIYLHRDKDYFLDEESSAGEDASQGIRSAVDNSTVKVSQGFQLTNAGLVEFIDVKLIKTGVPTGNVWFTLEANSGGVPSNTPLATSDKYDVSRITTTATWVRIPFRTPVSLSAATQYHLVAQGDWTVSSTNFISWRMDSTAATYAGGSKALFDSDTSTWTTDVNHDMIFKLYVTRNDTALTKPAGYTQSAVIGYVYNNSGSNFKHFWAKDRTVFCGYDADWQIGAFTSTTPLLVDLFAFLPPLPTVLECSLYNATGAHTALGNLGATDLTAVTSDARVGMVRAVVNTGWAETFPVIALDDYQGIMFITAGGTGNLYISSFEW